MLTSRLLQIMYMRDDNRYQRHHNEKIERFEILYELTFNFYHKYTIRNAANLTNFEKYVNCLTVDELNIRVIFLLYFELLTHTEYLH